MEGPPACETFVGTLPVRGPPVPALPVWGSDTMHTLLGRSSVAATAPCSTSQQRSRQHSRRDVAVQAASKWQGELADKRLMVLPGGAWFLSADADAEAPVYGDSFIMQQRARHGQQGAPRSTATGVRPAWSLLGAVQHSGTRDQHMLMEEHACQERAAAGWERHPPWRRVVGSACCMQRSTEAPHIKLPQLHPSVVGKCVRPAAGIRHSQPD